MSEQCIAIKKDGERCTNKVVPGTNFCFVKSHQSQALPQVEQVEIPQPKQKVPEVCGHINRHSYGADGKLDNLSCTMPKGHPGDHGAFHYEVHHSPPYKDPLNPRVVKADVMSKGEKWVAWLDIAGTPADEIQPDWETIDISKRPFREKDIGLK